MFEDLLGGETDKIEYKLDIPTRSEQYIKTVIAFANGSGGKLIFGIDDLTRQVVGISENDVFDKMDAITNSIYDSCEPKIMPNISIREINGKKVIVVDVSKGMQCPYYIKRLGVVEGTFIRVAGTTRKVQQYQLQELILKGTNRSYDQQVSVNAVDVERIKRFCDNLYSYATHVSVPDSQIVKKVTINQLISWKLVEEKDSLYYPTNAFLLLEGASDTFKDCTIQCAVFKGIDRSVFITRKEFGGSLYRQIEDAYSFVLQHIDLGAIIDGLHRQDYYELPVKAIREMIVNAVCHRSYLSPGKIQVALYDDRLEVTSPGTLDYEVTVEKIKYGLSKIRNKSLAKVFSYMGITESWGSGIPRIMSEARAYGLKMPDMIDMGSEFRISMYRQRTTQTTQTNQTNQTTQTKKNTCTIEDQLVLDLIIANPKMTQKQMADALSWPLNRVKYYINKLKRKRVIERVGTKHNGYWRSLE
ncbi:MAG: hypothetical protein CSB16_02650 [Clostridiales bacterium]|nr:MAG: hypothetical protein CSB16_02650 [Clostridiales bacterium]